MRDVGAQRLICVSIKGYPESVIEKALTIGPTVILTTLKDLETNEWPIECVSNQISRHRRELKAIQDAEIHVVDDKEYCINKTPDINEKLFEYYGRTLSMKELIFDYINTLEQQNNFLKNGIHKVKIKLPEHNEHLYILENGTKKDVTKLMLTAEIEAEVHRTPLKCRSYKRTDSNHPDAWIMEATVLQNNKEVELKITLTPDEKGHFYMRSWNAPDLNLKIKKCPD